MVVLPLRILRCIAFFPFLTAVVFCSLTQSKRPHYLIAVPRLYESLYKSITGSFKQARGVKKIIVALAMAVSAAYYRARDTSRGLVLSATAPGIIEKVTVLKGCKMSSGREFSFQVALLGLSLCRVCALLAESVVSTALTD
jgi:long-subunit acyl-CoA synthetase (AMP-forming)